MKLFHTENGKEVVYVQMQDIVQLNQSLIPMPASIFIKVFDGTVFVDDSNRFNFFRFDEEHEVKFFKDIEFIIDYDKYKEMTDEVLKEECHKLIDESNKIARKWNSMKENEREKNANLIEQRGNLNYMIKFVDEIYAIKHHKKTMPFPDFVQVPEQPQKRLFFEKLFFWRKNK